jgi:hypothetical protein
LAHPRAVRVFAIFLAFPVMKYFQNNQKCHIYLFMWSPFHFDALKMREPRFDGANASTLLFRLDNFLIVLMRLFPFILIRADPISAA